jgi:predicted nucleotidyltransferase
MEKLSATEFSRSFGKRNQDVQSETIEVTSYGRPVGYYMSPREYAELQARASGGQAAPTYHSMRNTVIAKAAAMRELAKRHKAKRIRLFGSVARGDDTPDSDIDFLVDLPKGYSLINDRLQLAVELEELFGRKIDLLVEAEMNKELAPSIMEEAIEL